MAREIDQQRTGPPVAEPTVGPQRSQRRRRRLAGRVAARAHPWALAELFVLSGFAVAQPLLEVTGKSPDFFLFHRAQRVDILLLVAGVTLLPALAIWAGEVLVGLVSEPLRRLVHLAAVTMLLTLLALEVVKKLTPVRGRRLVALAAVVGLLAGALYARQAWLKLWLRYLTPAPLVFALVFALAVPGPARGGGGQLRGDRARLPVQARRRPPPAPGLPADPQRRRPPPTARHPLGRVALRCSPGRAPGWRPRPPRRRAR